MKIMTAPRAKASVYGKTFIAVDVSGSARREQLAHGIKKAESIARAFGVTEASYIAFDHKIEFEKKTRLGKVGVDALMKHGGCGSDLRELFYRLDDCMNPGLVFVVTDMLLPFPELNPVSKATFVWIITEETLLPRWPTFGLFINSSREQ